MIRKFAVSNFMSINERQEMDLTIGLKATDPDGRFATPITGRPERLPKAAIVFGANASGKSNLLRAFSFVLKFVRDSFEWKPIVGIPCIPFGIENNDYPTTFEVEIDGTVPGLCEERRVFRYELAISPDRFRVEREALFFAPEGRMRRLFERDGKEISFAREFAISPRDPVIGKVRDNASVISTLAQFNNQAAMAILAAPAAIKYNTPIFGPRVQPDPASVTRIYLEDRQMFDRFLAIAGKFDLGITGGDIKVMEDGRARITFRHKGIDRPFPLDFESDGTQRMFGLYPSIHDVLESGGVAILDEIDTEIHPLLLPEIVGMFRDPETNPKGAQLIAACHNATLLEHLVKEEVFFTEKNGDGGTVVYGLKDIQAVRRDTNIYARYLMGAFGGVPRVA